MAAARKQKTPQSPGERRSKREADSGRSRSRNASGNVSGSRLTPWLLVAAVALFTVRLLIPAEATAEGSTLWVVQGWLALALLWVLERFRTHKPLLTWDVLTVAVLLLVAGHLLSGVAVFLRGGNKRAALNVMWEWVALGIGFFILRSLLREFGNAQRLLWALTGVAVALAGLGLHQHYIWLPQQRESYEQVRSRLDELREPGTAETMLQRGTRQQRIRELQNQLRQFGAPENPRGRRLWEERLYSDEPFGPFALANTFAGLLLVFLFTLVALLAGSFHPSFRWRPFVGPALAVLLVLWCLLLTKSRTAWVGGIAGAAAWWLIRPGGAIRGMHRWLRVAFLVAVAIVAVTAVTILSGGLDREVVSEAPKSLRYRWQYWTGTADLLQEFPVFGSGPGNFRAYYLKHKPAASSEEIRDPHNLVLDVWCNGGVAAVTGLLLLVVFVIRRAFAVTKNDEQQTPSLPPSTGDSMEPLRVWVCGVVGGFLLVLGRSWFVDDGTLDRHFAVLAGTLVALWATHATLKMSGILFAAFVASMVALLVHLTGAGGIEMPAITQLVLLLSIAVSGNGQKSASDEDAALPANPPEKPSADSQKPQSGQPQRGRNAATSQSRLLACVVGATTAAVLFGACLSTAMLPVMRSHWAMAAGDDALFSRGRADLADRFYRQSAEFDPFSPEPVRKLAVLAYSRWQRSRGDRRLLDAAIERQRIAVKLNERHFIGYWTLGRWLAERYRLSGRREDIEKSLEAFKAAVERYPHHAELLVEYAKALHTAGHHERAAELAARALVQDDVNRREGHVDKYLPQDVRKQMTTLREKHQIRHP